MENTKYKVSWEIDVWADSPREAAEAAWNYMRGPDSIANVFRVSDGSMEEVIDLNED